MEIHAANVWRNNCLACHPVQEEADNRFDDTREHLEGVKSKPELVLFPAPLTGGNSVLGLLAWVDHTD